MSYIYEIEMQVRDYECDIQGIVNNSVYQNYLEHCRHEFLHHAGLNFAKLHNDGIDALVTKIELEYKYPLQPRDRFIVKLGIHKEGRLRFVFDQAIYRQKDDKLIVKARVTGVLTKSGRPVAPDIITETLQKKGFTVEQI